MSQDGELYYYDGLGSIVFGWIEFGGSRYYAGSDGRLYRDGEYEIDSVKYLFDVSGICIREIRDEAWKQAYIDYIEDKYTYWKEDECEYCLIHIGDNKIPALICNLLIDGYYEISFYFNDKLETEWGELLFINQENLICIHTYAFDTSSYKTDTVYKIVNDKKILIAEGAYMDYYGEYLWNNKQVTEEEYYEKLHKVYDYSKAIELEYENYYTHSQILDVIANY